MRPRNIKNENKPVGGDEGDNASGSGGPGWPEACRREETIRKLLGRSEGERLKMGDVEEVTLELGVSRATLYRLITAYRQTPTVEALEPRPRFARANQRRELGRQRRVGHLEDRIGIASEFFDDPRDLVEAELAIKATQILRPQAQPGREYRLCDPVEGHMTTKP